MTRSPKLHITLPPLLSRAYAAARLAKRVPPLAQAAARGARLELADAGIDVPREEAPPPGKTSAATAARWQRPAEGDVYAEPERGEP